MGLTPIDRRGSGITIEPYGFCLQNVSMTGVDSRGQEGTPGDSIDGEKRRGIKTLRRKSCAINQLVDRR